MAVALLTGIHRVRPAYPSAEVFLTELGRALIEDWEGAAQISETCWLFPVKLRQEGPSIRNRRQDQISRARKPWGIGCKERIN
jgi:hypothetical protein